MAPSSALCVTGFCASLPIAPSPTEASCPSINFLATIAPSFPACAGNDTCRGVVAMSRLTGTATAAVRWVGAEIAPLVLLTLAVVLVWVSVWKVWLPAPDAGTPSRRSVTLAIVLLVLGVGAAVIGVFHDRLRRIELTRTGVSITLTQPERVGLGALVERLAASGAPPAKVAEAIRRY